MSQKPENYEIDHRPWGKFKVLAESPIFKIKEITVYPNSKTSYQSHHKRNESWAVLKGSADIILEDEVFPLGIGDCLFIEREQKHRVVNNSDENFIFIEIQTGDYFGEDDIIRYNDDYGRS